MRALRRSGAGPRFRGVIGWGTILLATAGAACAQRAPTSADSGWAPLFDGRDFDGLYIRLAGTLQDPAKQGAFRIEDGTLHVSASGGIGAIATEASYSRYQVRVEYRFGKGQGHPNAGLLYHIDTADWRPGDAFGTRNAQVPYFAGAYAKGVEYQMYRGDAGAFLGIMNVWVTAETKGDANHTWKPGGVPYTAYPTDGLADRRIYRSVDAAPDDTDWVRFEGRIRGADNVEHIVNGITVMKGKDLRHNRKTAITSKDDPERLPMDRGHIGLQSEGAEVWYRNWQVRLLDEADRPIIPGCRVPTSPDYNPLANRDGTGPCRSTALRAASAADDPAARGNPVSPLGERGGRHLTPYRTRPPGMIPHHSPDRPGPGTR
jgi:hypothetical protein